MLKKISIMFTLLFLMMGSTTFASDNGKNGLSIEELSKETGIEMDYLKKNYEPEETFEILSSTSEIVSPLPTKHDGMTLSSKTPLYNFTLTVARTHWASSKHVAIVESKSLNGMIDEIEARSRIYFQGKLEGSDTDKQKNSVYAGARAQAGCTFGIIGDGKADVYGNHTFKLKGYPNVSKETRDNFKCAHF